MLNLAGLTLFFRWDLTANRIYSLSETSQQVVATLKEPLTIKVFFTRNLPAPHNATERYLHDLLEEYGVYANRLKVALAEELTYLCPAPLDDDMVDELNWLAAAVFRVTGALDVARVDFRLNVHENWKPYILEINPLPGLSPGISDIVMEAAAEGVDHPTLVNMILDTALRRYGMID